MKRSYTHQLQTTVPSMRNATPLAPYAVLLALSLAALALASCSDSGPSAEERLQRARQDFEAFNFLAARDGFAQALEKDPENAEAAYGYARVLDELNQYEDAIAAYEQAMDLSADDPRVHEGYLNTLVWGGKLRGRRDWLDRAIEVGSGTIRAFPGRVEPYESVEDAVGELNQSNRWLEILDSLATDAGGTHATRIDASPVCRIHHVQARLTAARSAGDEEAAAAILDELRRELEAAGVVASGADADPGRQYFLAVGYGILGESELQRTWLSRLDETPEGRRMGGSMVHTYVHFMAHFAARDSSFEERLKVTGRWKRRFLPTWDSGDVGSYRVALSEELSILSQEARRQRNEAGRASPELLDRVMDTSRDLVRLDTWGGARRYSSMIRTLLDHDERLEEALELADEAIYALQQKQPGLIYPGVRADAMERSTGNWIAVLENLRGRALVALERDSEAEQSFLRAIDTAPRSDRLAALGRLLARQGRDEEAYAMLVEALARDTEDERLGNEADSIRAAAVEVASRLGDGDAAADAALLDADLEAARLEVAEAAVRRLVDDRLDRVAPDFSLTDTRGTEWQLSQLRGKVVVLNYWATWCGPCRSEFPHYRDLVNSYAAAEDVVFLAITTDVDHSETRQFLAENGYDFTVLYDEGSATDFGVNGIPAHYILGPNGRIQYASSGFPGAERYDREMRLRIEALRLNGETTINPSAAGGD